MTLNSNSGLNASKVSRARFRLRFSALAVAAALTISGVSGCSSPNSDETAESAQAATPVAIPEDGAGELAGWVVSQINAKSKVDGKKLTSLMDAVLLEGITAEELAKLLEERQSGGKWVPTDVKEVALKGDPCIFVRLKSESSNTVSILQVVQSSDTKLMNGIHFLAAGSVDFGATE